ncbi:alpha-2Db adrenergic receptor-like [Haliotis rubra]|uniref:alpha-2Db adrenergic receptor-like n=1 Tax=Haliotis rubra TaxID=36100 RepID=UPI001EE5D746|nr:alpha-2Db adrenergic receptor-like [Haliotis rubra]
MNSNISDLTSNEIEEYLRRHDDLYAIKYFPVILFLVILMLIGVLGNSLVCYVYIAKFKPSTTRCFVIALAVLDLINCFTSIPFEVIDMRHTYTFGEYKICRLMKLFETINSIASGSVLVAVAVDRFKKICRPLQIQMTTKVANISIAICCSLAVVLAVPAGFIYGGRTVPTDRINITGVDCSLSDQFIGSTLHIVYLGVQFLVFFGAALTIAVVYSLIWRQIILQKRFKETVSVRRRVEERIMVLDTPTDVSVNAPNTSVDIVSSSKSDQDECRLPMTELAPLNHGGKDGVRETPLHGGSGDGVPKNENSISHESDVTDQRIKSLDAAGKSENQPAMVSTADQTSLIERGNRSNSRSVSARRETRCSQRTKVTRRTTFMMFLITVTFVASFLPHLSLTIAASVKKNLLSELDGAGFVLFHIFQRSYFLQSASNPIIYSFWNANFRREIHRLSMKMTSKA